MARRPRASALSKQPSERVYGQARLTNQGPQRTLGQLPVVRYGQPTVWRLMLTEDDVAAGLMVYCVSELGEGSDGVPARDNG